MTTFYLSIDFFTIIFLNNKTHHFVLGQYLRTGDCVDARKYYWEQNLFIDLFIYKNINFLHRTNM